MSKEYDEDLVCTEGISVGNWLWGNVIITPQPNEISSISVTGLNLTGVGPIYPQASIKSAWPWRSCGSISVAPPDGAADFEEDPTSFRIFFLRVNDSETRLHWMVWRALEE